MARVSPGVSAGLLALLLALLLAAPAEAGPRTFRWGTVEHAPSAEEIRTMGKVRAKTLRMPFLWNEIETSNPTPKDRSCDPALNDPEFDWSYYDGVVRAASARGTRVLPIIMGSPRYAAPTPQQAPYARSAAIRDYRCFLRSLVKRYGRGGTLPSEPLTNVAPITDWQVWNEPNLRQYSPGLNPNPAEYARLLKRSYRQIVAVDSRATVVLAGMPEKTSSRNMNLRPYLKRLYKVRKIRRFFDAVAIHPYADNHRGVKGALLRLRALLDRLGDRRRFIWVTETGFSTGGGSTRLSVKTERGQARQLTRTFKMIRRNRKRWKVGSVYWFRWRDQSPNGNYFAHTGLYRRDGTAKPACRAYIAFTRGRCPDIPDPVAPPPVEEPQAQSAAEEDVLPSPPPR